MDRRLASIVLYLVLTSALAVVVLTQEPVGYRAFYITVELTQSVSEAQFVIPSSFATLWNKFEHFQFTEPWIIIVQDGVQRQSVVWYHDNTLYIAVYGLSTSTRRLHIYVVERQLLSNTALQLSQTYWNEQPVTFIPTVDYLLLGFGEVSYVYLRDVLAIPPHGFITLTERTYDGISVVKVVPLFTVDGRTYVANVYTTPHETVPLTALVVLHVSFGGGDEPIPIDREETLSSGGSTDFIVELTLSPPWFTDFSNTTLCIVEDATGSTLYYYTVEESVERRIKRIWVRLPSIVAYDGFTHLHIHRCGETWWDDLSKISGIFLSPGEYSVEYYLRYPRFITVHSFRYYDPYMSGGGLLPGNFTVWCTNGNVVQLNFTGHRDYFVPCDPVRYRLTFIREAPLSASLYIEPGDVIAPHLFDWSFDGVDDYVEIPHSESLNPAGDGFSIVLWLLLREYISPGAILTKRTDAYNGYFVFVSTGNVLHWDWGGFNYRWNTGYVPPLNTWQHIALVQRSDGRRLYVNASLVASTANKGDPALAATVAPLRISADTLALRYFNKMSISNVLIYRRSLSNDEVQQSYSSSVVDASGLVLFLDATFYNGTHYIDLSGSNNHGVPYGNVQRVPAERRWIWHIKGFVEGEVRHIHIRFVPRGWFIEFRRVSDGALLLLIDTSQYPANAAGLVEDIPIEVLGSGWYIVNFRPSYPFGAPSPPYYPPELPPPDEGEDGGDGGGGGGFDCSICEPCWTDPSFDFCSDCYAFCEPPGWTPPPEPEAPQVQQPQRQQQQVVREVQRETQQYSLLLIAALFTGVVGVAFFVVGSAAIGLVPHVIYVLVLAELLPMWIGALLIASMVILSLYVFLSRRASGGGVSEGG